MPVGEFIAEVGARIVAEILIYGIGYWIGYAVLKVCTLGSISLAPFSTISEKNKGSRIDWSFFLYRGGRRMLKAEVTALVGLMFIAGVGCLVYFLNA